MQMTAGGKARAFFFGCGVARTMELFPNQGGCMVLASDIDLELYPYSDGKPMAENKVHYKWITTIEGNLESLFADDPMVFIAADMNWHPIPRSHPPKEGEYVAPDVMVVFGVPKGEDSSRNSYIQHLEGNIPPQVVFEIYSPSNKAKDFDKKFEFYERYGVEEYYCIYPKENLLEVWLRVGQSLRRADWRDVWVSKRLGVTFDATGETLQLFDPDGNPFRSFGEERQGREQAEAERDRERAEKAALLEKLRAAGIDPDSL